jgi:hypothetical protein
MRRILRRRAQRALDHGGHLIVVDRSRSSWASLVQQAFDAIRQESPTPLPDGVLVEPEFIGDGFAQQAIGASQDDVASLRK